jgi:hypothetical protein
MYGLQSEERILRERTAALEAYRDNRRSGSCEGTQRCAVQIASLPSTPGGDLTVYNAFAVIGFDFEDRVGATATAVLSSETMAVVVLGEAPRVGDQLICSAVGGRWVCENRGEGPQQSTCTVTICTDSSVCSNGIFTPATGVSVAVTNSSGFSAQGTTPSGSGSSGCITLAIPASGEFTIATSSSRYADTSVTTNLSCGGRIAIALDQATGTICSCLASEPIPAMLIAKGGDGSTTIDPTNLTFTLPASVDVLVPDNGGTCNGSIEANPCTTGSDLTVQFTPGQDPNACLSIVESWTRSSDCNQSEGAPLLPDALSLYLNAPQGGFTEQWLSGPPSDVDSVCMGFVSQDDLSTGNSGAGPFPVPINKTINFPAGGFSSPPISSITITEPTASQPNVVAAEFPSLATQAGNALGALGRAVGAAASGQFVWAPAEVVEERQNECETCENMLGDRCKICGCWYRQKIKLARESCPMSQPRWKAYHGDETP